MLDFDTIIQKKIQALTWYTDSLTLYEALLDPMKQEVGGRLNRFLYNRLLKGARLLYPALQEKFSLQWVTSYGMFHIEAKLADREKQQQSYGRFSILMGYASDPILLQSRVDDLMRTIQHLIEEKTKVENILTHHQQSLKLTIQSYNNVQQDYETLKKHLDEEYGIGE